VHPVAPDELSQIPGILGARTGIGDPLHEPLALGAPGQCGDVVSQRAKRTGSSWFAWSSCFA
jgi:hypothetical protein